MITPTIFTGGDLATNAYLLPVEGGVICFDAPEGLAAALKQKNITVKALVLTHGHFDHMWDSALIQDDHKCPVYVHADDASMVKDPSVFSLFGVREVIQPVTDLTFIEVPDRGSAPFVVSGEKFQVFHIPGHSKGGLAIYHEGWGLVIPGDILFAGGVGRWDLPGGSHEDLMAGIRKHLLTLPDETRVYPGHGGATTIGEEKESNPFLAE
jgi:hydroxyacylglutathione hydrolase